MGIGVPPTNATAEEDDRRKPIRRQGVGGLLLLVGVGLTFSESSVDTPSVAGGLGFLLLLVGAGLIIHRQPEARPAR